MIELNLLPEDLKRKKRQIVLPDIPFIPMTTGIIVIFVLIQLFLSSFIFIKQKQIKSLDATWQKLAPEKKELGKIKTALTNTGKTNQAIEALMSKRISWSKLLNNLSNDLTNNIWLTDLSYDETEKKSASSAELSRTLTLSGTATGLGEEPTAHVARFITALKSDKNFFDNLEDIELISIKKSVIAGQDVMNFTLVCKFKSEKKGS